MAFSDPSDWYLVIPTQTLCYLVYGVTVDLFTGPLVQAKISLSNDVFPPL